MGNLLRCSFKENCAGTKMIGYLHAWSQLCSKEESIPIGICEDEETGKMYTVLVEYITITR